jgi:ORF6N domain-containing protein
MRPPDMPSSKLRLRNEAIDDLIREIRGVRVILDTDLAALYGVTTKRLNEQVKRNRERFPADFAFQLTAKESVVLRSQFATSSSQEAESEEGVLNRSQIATGSQKHRDPRLRPYAFTEHGAIMAANVLNSSRAVQMSVFVIRAFVKMRETLLGTRELAKKLAALEKQLTGRLDSHEAAIVHVVQELMLILNPPAPPPAPPRPKIGFVGSR